MTSSARAWCGPVWPLCTSLSWSPLSFSSMCPCPGCPWNCRTEADVSIADDTLSFTSALSCGTLFSHYFLSKQHSPGADGGGSGDSRSFFLCQWTIPDETLRLRGVSQKVRSPVIFDMRAAGVDQMILLLLNINGNTLSLSLFWLVWFVSSSDEILGLYERIQVYQKFALDVPVRMVLKDSADKTLTRDVGHWITVAQMSDTVSHLKKVILLSDCMFL